MPKRRLDEDDDPEAGPCDPRRVRVAPKHNVKKHSLDSDEEDSGAEEIPDQEEHLEGQEDATISMEGGVSITPFNMREELEEGHFDADGHYHWKKEKEIKDGWLDNIEWVKIQGRPEDKYKVHKADDDLKGLGDDSSSESEDEGTFDLITSYKEMISYMKEKETVLNALRRLGASKKMSSVERWKRKKAGTLDEGSEDVTKLTSVANEILSKTGNMDIYQMTYEKVKSAIDAHENKNKAVDLDMYADDFDCKEKQKMNVDDDGNASQEKKEDSAEEADTEQMWEFKWSQEDDAEVHGPHATTKMHEWSTEGFFKTGVWVRKCGQDGPFYTSNRIDFELYL